MLRKTLLSTALSIGMLAMVKSASAASLPASTALQITGPVYQTTVQTINGPANGLDMDATRDRGRCLHYGSYVDMTDPTHWIYYWPSNDSCRDFVNVPPIIIDMYPTLGPDAQGEYQGTWSMEPVCWIGGGQGGGMGSFNIVNTGKSLYITMTGERAPATFNDCPGPLVR